MFRVTPGHVPDWVYNSCRGGCALNIADLIATGLLVAGIVTGKAIGWWVLVIAIIAVVSWLSVIGEFAARERFGRARIYQGQ